MSDIPGMMPILLLVDDNDTFREVMARALMRRGFAVKPAHDAASALEIAAAATPDYAVIDLKMPGDSGLVLLKQLKALAPSTCIVILTGYASISTAVEAVKLGATQYLAKPVDVDEVIAAFNQVQGDAAINIAPTPLSVDQMEWEHIQRVLSAHHGNISATARALNMHRRTLQRKLAKHAPNSHFPRLPIQDEPR